MVAVHQDRNSGDAQMRSLRLGREECHGLQRALLIVDDDDDVRTLLARFFMRLGVQGVLEARNGVEAVAAVRQNPQLQVILLDLLMPVMDGVEALRQIRQINGGVSVVVLTGFPYYTEVPTVMNNGGFAFIPKPIDLNYLEGIVKACIMTRRTPRGSAGSREAAVPGRSGIGAEYEFGAA